MMKVTIRSAFLALAATLSLALSGCLQDEKDPAAVSDVGKLTGTYYASGLGNIAVQIQNAVMGNATWFAALGTSMELNLAAMGISTSAMGSQVRSYVCPSGDGSSVQQFTWIDGRTDDNKFSVKGIGTDAGAIVNSLRSRVAPTQVGIYNGGEAIDMASGEPLAIPSSCGGIPIPAGTPVVSFRIDRPAPPTEELARTEYRTVSCGVDESGLARRGTAVQKRIISFRADGTIVTGAWETDNMGNCVDDVVVQITDREKATGGGTADLGNFAAIALRELLSQQLAMDCMSVSVESNKSATKNIDTCGTVRPDANQAIESDDENDGTDQRILDCKGSTAVNMIRFTNLRGDKLGLSTTSWTSGTATIIRTLYNESIDSGASQEANRYKWLGTNIDCGGGETFFVQCAKIPGDPPLEARRQGNKWTTSGIEGQFVQESWFAGVFNLCWFGSCTRIIGGSITKLNPQYFTGTSIHTYAGTTTNRGMEATSWLNNETFKPNPQPSTLWRLPDSSNFCIWEQRVMIAQCPLDYDPSQQGSWMPSYRYYHGRPAALDPGIGSDGSSAGQAYRTSRNRGELTANVTFYWEDCNWKGCDYWTESAGPGTGVYIKSWQTTPPNNGLVYLSPSAKDIRAGMCQDLNFQLNASSLVVQAQQNLEAKQAIKTQREAELTSAQGGLAAAQADLTSAQGEANVMETVLAGAQVAVVNRTNQQTAAQEAYDDDPTPANQTALNTANANLATAQAALDTAQANRDGAQAALDDAQDAYDTALAVRDNAQSAYDAAAVDVTTAAGQLAQAQAASSMGMGRNLTETERGALQAIYSGSCASQGATLNATEQQMIRSTCVTHYSNPAAYAALPSIGYYCDAVFDRNASTGELKFKETQPASGFNIQTTLLNTEGVMLAHKPTLVNNETLVVKQRDFTQPLNCLRQEERYFSWPRLYYYWVCAGKGGCWQQAAIEYVTITESTTRQWTGLSYTGGSWSLPSHGYRSAYGSWDNISQIPNPLH